MTELEPPPLSASDEGRPEDAGRKSLSADRQWADSFDAVHQPIFIHDREGRLLQANRAYLEQGGQPWAEAAGLPYWRVFPRRESPLPACQQAMTTMGTCQPCETLHCEERFEVPERGQTWVSRAYAVVGADGRYRHSIHVLNDITQHLSATAERRYLAEALRHASNGIVVVDADLSVRYANPALGSLLGQPPEALAGRNLAQVLSPHIDEPRPGMRASLAEAGQWQGDTTLRAADGTTVPIHLVMTAMQAENAQPVGYVGILTDLRELRRREQHIAGLNATLAGILAAAPVGIGKVVDRVFEFVSDGLCRMLGYRAEELLGRSARMVYESEAEFLRVGEIKYAQIRAAGHGELETRMRRRDGTLLDVLLSSNAIDPQDLSQGVIFAVQDVTARKLAEQALHQERDLLQHYLDVADVMFLVLDPEGRVERINRRGCEILGLPAEEVVGQDWFERFILPEERTKLRALYAQVLGGEHTEDNYYENHVQTRNGPRLIALTNTRLMDADGQYVGTLSSGADVTEQRRLDTLFRAITEQAGEGLSLADAAGDYRLVNPAFCRMMGYSREELLRLNVRDLVPQDIELQVFPQAVAGQSGQRETLLRRKDGSTFMAEVLGYPVDVGAERLVLGFIRDVTERRLAEQALKSSEERFRALFERASDGILLAEISTRQFIAANAAICRKLGYTEAELLSLRVDDIHPPEALTQVLAAFEAQTREETGVAEGLPVRRKDGTGFIADVSSATAELQGRQCLIGIFRDTTERERHAAQLRQLNRTLHTLTACNSVLIHAASEEELLQRICATIVEFGGYRMVWVGYAEQDEARTVRPIVAAGEGQDYVAGLGLTWDLTQAQECPTCLTLNSGESSIEQDLAAGPQAGQAWRRAALERGFRSMAVLPLVEGERIFGALTLFAAERGAFSVEELRLLLELADDLSYGIRALRERLERARAEERVQESEQFLRLMFEHLSDGVLLLDGQGVIMTANPAAGRLLRTTAQALPGHEFGHALPSGDTPVELDLVDSGSEDAAVEMHVIKTRWYGQSVAVATLHDISIHRQLERERSAHEKTLERALLGTIRALALAVEKRDPYTAGHQHRVAELAVAIGREMGLDEDRLLGIQMGGTIHDIGKIYIPAEILNRPGRLSEVELGLIMTHPEVGHDIIQEVEFPWPVVDMVYQHHERLDGSGYPQGLAGEAIALEARILAVADVVEAITSHRPYRPALGLNIALEEIRAKRGRLYDAQAADACLDLFESGRFRWASGRQS